MHRTLKVTCALVVSLVACRGRQVEERSSAPAMPTRHAAVAPVLVTEEFFEKSRKRLDCLRMAHIGNQDHPIGSVEMCPGPRGRAAEDPLRRDRHFEFDSVALDSLRNYLLRQEIPPPPRTGPVEFGTFLLTWDGNSARKEVVLVPFVACRILRDLPKVLSADDYASFAEAVSDLRRSVGCAEPQPSKE